MVSTKVHSAERCKKVTREDAPNTGIPVMSADRRVISYGIESMTINEHRYKITEAHHLIFMGKHDPHENDTIYAQFFAKTDTLPKRMNPVWIGDIDGRPDRIQKIKGKRGFECSFGQYDEVIISKKDWEARYFPNSADSKYQ